MTDVANALDAALWDGTGASNTIKGILRQTGIQTGVLDLTHPDSLIDGLALAQGNKVSPTHWVMTSASFAAVRKVKVGTRLESRCREAVACCSSHVSPLERPSSVA